MLRSPCTWQRGRSCTHSPVPLLRQRRHTATCDPNTRRWKVAGTEFDRTRKNLNFVASPVVTLPFHAYTTDPSSGSVSRVWNLSVRFGVEAGNNFRNSLDDNGYGGFARTLGGATNSFIFRKVLSFDRISLTSDYEVRLPSRAELFSDSTIPGRMLIWDGPLQN